jgi:hypothetical protein
VTNKTKTNLMLFLGVAFLSTLPAPGGTSELCSGGSVAASASSGKVAFLALLQSPPALPEAFSPDAVNLPTNQGVPKAAFCSKEVCSAARQECLEWCPYPCRLEFRCATPYCGECVSCTC